MKYQLEKEKCNDQKCFLEYQEENRLSTLKKISKNHLTEHKDGEIFIESIESGFFFPLKK